MITNDRVLTEKEIQSVFKQAGINAAACIFFLAMGILIQTIDIVHHIFIHHNIVLDLIQEDGFFVMSALNAYVAVILNGRAMIAIMNKIIK